MRHLEIFHNLLKEDIEGYDGELVKDYISEENIYAIEVNISFFLDIPTKEIKSVFEKLIELIYYYSTDLYNKEQKDFIRNYELLKTELTKEEENIKKYQDKLDNSIKPITQINKDLKIIKQYQDMIIRLYGTSRKRDKDNSIIFFNIPDELDKVYNTNIKIINDLELKKFQIISKYRYYSLYQPSKTKIKIFLKELKKKYKLRNVSLQEKQLIDMIRK